MKNLWLIFAQAVTVSVAVMFVITTWQPDWFSKEVSVGTAPTRNIPQDTTHNEVVKANASYRDAAKSVLPGVVHVYTTQAIRRPRNPLLDDPVLRYFFGDRLGERRGEETQRTAGLGSGVIVSHEGYILTNYHVIEMADAIEVALNDGRKFKATLVGTDPESDLAVLRIRPPKNDPLPLPTVRLGDIEQVQVGDVVLAIGNPFGVGQSVTMGIVSALGRSHLGINTFENFIQTDAAINPGNSGGALTDASGQLIGINTAIYSRSGGSLGIGFAIPVSIARQVMEQIIQNGSVIRGWIGVETQEITPELADSFALPNRQGVLIAGVVRGGPADIAGVRPGDVLYNINQSKVTHPQMMLDKIAGIKPGEQVALGVYRDKAWRELTVKIGKRPPQQDKLRE